MRSVSLAAVATLVVSTVTFGQSATSGIRICAGGDMMLGTNLDTAWVESAGRRLGRPVPALPDPLKLLAPLRPLVHDADIVLLNVEGAIGEGPAPRKCRPGSRSCYAFRQPIGTAAAIREFSGREVIVANLANNHAMDAGLGGFLATERYLEEAGVYVTGVDTLATVVPLLSGDTVAFLGFAAAQAGPDPRDLDAVRRHVRRAASKVSRLVVTMHMGAEGVAAQRTRDSTERYLGENRGNVIAFARAAVEEGASLVIGHGPHVLRAMEWYGEALVVYSLGNLLTYGPFSMAEPLNRGGMLCAVIDVNGRVSEAALRPTYQLRAGTVAPDPTGRAVWLVDSLSRLDFPNSGVTFRIEGVTRRPDGTP